MNTGFHYDTGTPIQSTSYSIGAGSIQRARMGINLTGFCCAYTPALSGENASHGVISPSSRQPRSGPYGTKAANIRSVHLGQYSLDYAPSEIMCGNFPVRAEVTAVIGRGKSALLQQFQHAQVLAVEVVPHF